MKMRGNEEILQYKCDYEIYKGETENLGKTVKKDRCRLKNKELISPLLRILITEDFLNGIFGKEFWNIFENDRTFCDGYFASADFEISEYTGGLKVSFLLRNCRRGNMEKNAVNFSDNTDVDWKWLDSNYINFVFFYDPKKDEISHVRLQDKVTLNYETIQKGETKDVLLTADGDDFYRPNSFWFEVNADDIVEHYRRLTKNKEVKFEVIENNILKTCNRFNKDKKGFIEMLSLWARQKTKKNRKRTQKNFRQQ